MTRTPSGIKINKVRPQDKCGSWLLGVCQWTRRYRVPDIRGGVLNWDSCVKDILVQDRCACQWTGQVGSGIFYRCVHIHLSHERVPLRSSLYKVLKSSNR